MIQFQSITQHMIELPAFSWGNAGYLDWCLPSSAYRL